MPALPDVPGVLKVSLHWAIEGDPMADTILHFHYTGGVPSFDDVAGVASVVDGQVSATLAPEYQSGIQFLGCEVRDLSSPMGQRTETSVTTPGTRAGTRLAPGTCALSNYGISRTYRGGKPRSYWPFGVSADVAATGFWADAFVTEYQVAVETFFDGVIGSYSSITVDYQVQVSYYGPPNRVLTNPSTGRARTVSTRRDAPGGTGAPIVDRVASRTSSKIISSQRRRNRNA
jgi:hypothetical protein